MLKINDKAGRRPAAEIRSYFENAVRNTDVLAKALPLDAVLAGGQFSHYANAAADNAWVGFALGMRGADQLAERRELLARQVPEWQSIDSAPKDYGTTIYDVWANGVRVADCWWGRPTYGPKVDAIVCQTDYDSNGPVDSVVENATHWMPVAAAPKADETKEGGSCG